MIFYKNGWRLCSEKAKYIQHGEEITQYVMSEGHDWWLDFEEKWEHTEIIEFIPVEPTEEQLNRFEEVIQLNIPERLWRRVKCLCGIWRIPRGD